MVIILLNREIKLETCTSLCNSILKDELAQLVRTLNKRDQVHGHEVSHSVSHQVRQSALHALVCSPVPRPLQVHATTQPLRAQTKQGIQINANPLSPWKTSGLTGQALAALLRMCQFTGPTPTVCVSSRCNMYATDHKRFPIYVTLEKNL